MNVRTARPSRARPAGFRPQVEALEERTMLDASAVLVGDTLIIGTSKADHIHIVDQGNFDSSKTVTVFSHGVQKLQAPGTLVRRITFSTGLKDDTVLYQLTGPLSGSLPGSERIVHGSLGGGN